MNKKSIFNPMKRIVTVMLAVAMVFSVNLTSMTAHAAVAKPTKQTVLTTMPAAVAGATIGGKTATFYTDDNDSVNTYIRYMYPASTPLDTLSNVSVSINTNFPITENGVVKSKTFNADLLNKTVTVVIANKTYIIAAGIESGNTDLATTKMDGYVSAATLNGTTATVTRTITAGTCIGNIYYAQQKITWTNETLKIDAKNAATPANTCAVAYTLADGSQGNTTADLSTGSVIVKINNKDYAISATFAAETSGFKVTSTNFRIDFTELKDYKTAGKTLNSGYSWDTIDKQMKEITDAQSAWYATNPTFAEGATCMDVLQDFLKFATTKGYFTCGTTDVDKNCTYVQNIDGLCPFTLSNGMDGWMYTDRPNEAGVAPKNWYTAPIGAADYVLSSDTQIAWFFVTDYSTHPWQ